jgi:hypothetical protein
LCKTDCAINLYLIIKQIEMKFGSNQTAKKTRSLEKFTPSLVILQIPFRIHLPFQPNRVSVD